MELAPEYQNQWSEARRKLTTRFSHYIAIRNEGFATRTSTTEANVVKTDSTAIQHRKRGQRQKTGSIVKWAFKLCSPRRANHAIQNDQLSAIELSRLALPIEITCADDLSRIT